MDGNPYHSKAETESESRLPSLQPSAALWEITVRGHLNGDWSDWLDGLQITPSADGDTVLSGTIVDQAALMGILFKLNRLNVTLLSLRQVITKESHR